ncbi:MAG: Fe-S-containing protein [Burkholderiaceae bacterium]|jgi:uncharacterized membrane protein/YHS domain-containing protein|nr:Fe-S-containing protein [Burkholderiaceae bacterium]
MSYFWASILSAFLATALLLAAHWGQRKAHGMWAMALPSVGALLAGIALGLSWPAQQKAMLAFNLVYLGALALFVLWQFMRWREWFWPAALLVALAGVAWGGTSAELVLKYVLYVINAVLAPFVLWLFMRGRREWFWHVLLIALAGVAWGRTSAVLALTSTHVINTALLLNLGSVVAAFAACALLGWLLCPLLRDVPVLRWLALLGAVLSIAVPLGGQVVLLLMKLQVLELTKGNLSFAARTTNLPTLIAYPLLALVGVLLLAASFALLRPRWRACKAASTLIARRIALADFRAMRLRLLALAAIVLAMLAGQLYWDRVASRPPALSEATRVALRADGAAHLALAPLMDGNLHRFAWVADDGRLVRFFVINRLDDRVAPVVVLDACLLCGDKGYVQQGDQVVCVGCGVHMFKPSLGKPGGCNPVPVENWKVVAGEIVIPKAALEAGLQLFSTVLTIEVTDPVSGTKLTNTSAPHRYNYANKTYFFADEAALNAFRDDPERYIGAPPQPLPPPQSEPAASGAPAPAAAALSGQGDAP